MKFKVVFHGLLVGLLATANVVAQEADATAPENAIADAPFALVPGNDGQPTLIDAAGRQVPFFLVPDETGKVTVLDAKGHAVPAREAPSLSADIRELNQITVLKSMTAASSCYYLVYVGGQWYKIPC